MSKNTREMIEKAYEIYHSPEQDVTPLVKMGMNENSAKMTLTWFKYIFAGKFYKRIASATQVEFILNKLYDDHDKNRLALVLQSKTEYLKHYQNSKIEGMVKLFKKKQTKMDTTNSPIYPDEIDDRKSIYIEGAKKTITVNAYERKPTEKELELMQNFDPQIIETIADVLKNSKNLLGIEEWQNFELDFSTPVEEKNEIFKKIKKNINDFKNVAGIYAIFDSDTCLYIGQGKRIWERIKSHYKAGKGLDYAKKWVEFFKQYQKNLKIFWIEYIPLNEPPLNEPPLNEPPLNEPALDDKLRELFEHVLKIKYDPLFDSYKYS